MNAPEPMHPSEAKARNMIKGRTTYQLIADWEEADRQPFSEGLVVIRGFLMDELETRNKPAFDCWLESNEASPRKFFIPEDEEPEDSTYTQEYDDFTDADPGL